MIVLEWNQPIYIFNDFRLFLAFFTKIHECANYANMITCIIDHEMKGLSLSFTLVQISVIYGYKQVRYYWSYTYAPFRESHFECFYKYLWIRKLDHLHMQQGDNRPVSKL